MTDLILSAGPTAVTVAWGAWLAAIPLSLGLMAAVDDDARQHPGPVASAPRRPQAAYDAVRRHVTEARG